MAAQTLRIRLKVYDHKLIDKSTEKIVKTVKQTGAYLVQFRYHLKEQFILFYDLLTLIRNQEQFQTKTHKRLIEILNASPKTVDALMKLDLSAGVDIEIKA